MRQIQTLALGCIARGASATVTLPHELNLASASHALHNLSIKGDKNVGGTSHHRQSTRNDALDSYLSPRQEVLCAVNNSAGQAILPGKPKTWDTYPGTGWFQWWWEPCIGCGDDERVGPLGDGGKWICNPQKLLAPSKCNLLSIGSNNDFRFEREIVKRWNCTVHIYDASSEPPRTDGGDCHVSYRDPELDWCRVSPHIAKRIKFYKQYLGVSDSSKSTTLESAIRRLQLDSGSRSIFSA